MADYLKTIYNEDARPLNSYPGKLAKYIVSNFKLKSNIKFFRWSKELMLIGYATK